MLAKHVNYAENCIFVYVVVKKLNRPTSRIAQSAGIRELYIIRSGEEEQVMVDPKDETVKNNLDAAEKILGWRPTEQMTTEDVRRIDAELKKANPPSGGE